MRMKIKQQEESECKKQHTIHAFDGSLCGVGMCTFLYRFFETLSVEIHSKRIGVHRALCNFITQLATIKRSFQM